MSTFFFRNRRYLAIVLLLIISAGSSALLTIGRQEDPTITNLFATIQTPFPGADPARVEALVTEEIESELRGIAAIKTIESVSRTGISTITVELSEFISDREIEIAWSEIRDALSDAAVAFPPGVPEPEFNNDETTAYTAISALVARDGAEDLPPGLLSRFGEELQDRMRLVAGTQHVKLLGAVEEEITVTVIPERLASLGLRPDDVAAALAAADAKVRSGRIRGSSADYLIEVAGEFETVQRIASTPLVTGEDGQTVRLSDIATIEKAVRTPVESIVYANGQRAVVVASIMAPNQPVEAWMGRMKQQIATFEDALPRGIEHKLLFDQSTYTADRLESLLGNLAIGISLVVAVLLLTLGWRSALIVSAILPLAGLMAVAVLLAIGIPIHQMSVTGLIVALGLLVDSAIVMVDEVRQRLRGGLPRSAAVAGAVKRLTMPLFASTATTVLAFLPMAILPGPAGDFVGAIAISVIIMLVASFLLSITVASSLAGWVLPAGEAKAGFGRWTNGIPGGPIARLFEAALRLSLRHRVVSIAAAMALPVIGFGAFPSLTAQFFPGVDRDQFYVQISLPDGTAIAATQESVRRAMAIIEDEGGVTDQHWFIGESAPAFYYNMTTGRAGIPGFAEGLMTTQSADITTELVKRLQTRLDRELPEAQVLVRGLVQGPPVNAPVEMRLVGPGLETLRLIGEEARRRLAAAPGVTQTSANLMGGGPKLVFDLDEDKVRSAGLTLSDVAGQLEGLIEGQIGGSVLESTENLPVRIRIAGHARASVAEIASLRILPATGDTLGTAGFPGVPLSALGTVRLEPSASPITRRNGERVNTVQAYLVPDILPEESLAAFQADLEAEPLQLPPGYRIEWGGDSDARDETVRNLMAPLGLVIALTIAVVVLTFNSFRLSLITFSVAILSVGLSILSLAVLQYPFGITALIGVIGSIGVSINAAIIIMTAFQEDEGAAANEPDALVRVIMGSSRHIVSTTVTTFGSFLPLILEGGGFWPPFATAIAGGVLLSTVVSFFYVPPLYSLVVGRRGIRYRGTEPAAPPETAVATSLAA